MSQVSIEKRGSLSQQFTKFTKSYAIVIAIILLLIAYTIGSQLMFGEQYFFTWNNLRNILNQTVTLAVVCCGQALIVTTGQLDLSRRWALATARSSPTRAFPASSSRWVFR